MTPKQQFIAELEPLLIAAEQAITRGDREEARRLSMATIALASEYAARLDPVEFRDALNSPTANAIAKRLGVQP